MHDLEDVHRLLDEVEDEISRLKVETRDEIDVLRDAGNLCLTVSELMGWGTAYSEDSIQLGIAAPLLSKFVKMRGRVRTRDALAVAERVRSYVRSFDQVNALTNVDRAHPLPVAANRPKFSFHADKWVTVTQTSKVKGQIAAIAALLDNIIEQTSKSNLAGPDQILTEIERKQLVAVLETALSILKSPLAEKGLLQKARDGLQRAAISAAEKGVQSGLGHLAELAVEKITELMKSIF